MKVYVKLQNMHVKRAYFDRNELIYIKLNQMCFGGIAKAGKTWYTELWHFRYYKMKQLSEVD